MARSAAVLHIRPEDGENLRRIVHSGKEEYRMVFRASIILQCSEGKRISDIAADLKTRPNTVIKWRDRYVNNGISGLHDSPRKGKPEKYPKDLRKAILELTSGKPPEGYAVWNGRLIAENLNVSEDKVWRILRGEGIQLQRHRSWCVSTDPEFTSKAADIVGLYLDPPDKAIILSVDEKPGIQALSRTTGYVETDSGKIVRAYKSTYRRNGTLNLFAALTVLTGSVKAETTKRKTRVDFLAFMDRLIDGLPKDHGEIHVILDNYRTHKGCDDWLSRHQDVTFHYTPTSASWLNEVEIWFSIMSRAALKGSSFESTENLSNAIKAFVEDYNKHPKPFKWRKREVKGSQIRDTIVNLRN